MRGIPKNKPNGGYRINPTKKLARLAERLKQKKKAELKLRNFIRLDEQQQVDDVAIDGDLFRMERMDDDCWWVCVYRRNKRTAFNLFIEDGQIQATVIEDELECVDDSRLAARLKARLHGRSRTKRAKT